MLKLGSLFGPRPRWLHKDAEVRLAAVNGGHEPELMAALPTLAREDSSAKVRQAAARRIDAPAQLLALYESDDVEIKTVVRNRIKSLLLAADVPAELRLQWPRISDNELLDAVAQSARDENLRVDAVVRSGKASHLLAYLGSGANAARKAELIAKLNDPALLERVMEQTRKTDKHSHRAAESRLDELKLRAGDATTLAKFAQRHLDELNQALRTNAFDLARLNQLQQDFDALGPGVSEAQRSQFNAALRTAKATLSAPELIAERARDRAARRGEILAQRQAAAAQMISEGGDAIDARIGDLTQLLKLTAIAFAEVADGASEAELQDYAQSQAAIETQIAELVASRPASPAYAALSDEVDALEADPRPGGIAQARRKLAALRPELASEQALAAGLEARLRGLEARLDELRQAREAAAKKAQELIGPLEQALEGGDTRHALELDNQIREAQRSAGRELLAPAFVQRYAALGSELGRLRSWQSWSHAEHRQELITQAEALAQAQLSPDALNSKARDLKAQWLKLDALEGHGARSGPKARQFYAALRSALEPADAFFKKRKALDSLRTKEIELVLEQLAQLPERIDEPEATLSLRKLVSAALDELRDLPGKARGHYAKRLIEARARLDALLDRYYEGAEADRRALITRAQKLPQISDVRSRLAEVKNLQAAWRSCGRLPRKRDQALWESFRSAIDAVFDELKREREDRDEQDRAQRDAIDQVAARAEEIARSAEIDFAAARAELVELRARLDELDANAGPGYERFKRAQKALEDRAREARLQAAQAVQARLEALEDQLDQLPDPAGVPAELATELEQLSAAHPHAQALRLRIEHGQQGIPPWTNEALDELMLALEFQAGAPSPEAYASDRMSFQVKRLAGRMRGETGADFDALYAQWLAAPVANPARRAELKARARAALRHYKG